MTNVGTIVADAISILNRCGEFCSSFTIFNHSTSIEGSEICTAEAAIPDPSLLEVELVIKTLKNTKLPE